MKKLILFIGLVSVSTLVFCQEDGFREGMKNGFELFDKGETYKEWVKGAESLVKLSEKYPDEWLSYHWASYMYTQLARASKRDPKEGGDPEKLVDLAQKYLDLASSRIKDKTAEQEVDFHMLQQLIYRFRNAPADNPEKFKKLAEEELKTAIMKDPNHHTVLASVGINLLFAEDSYANAYAARVLLLKAKEIFNARVKPRYMTTHYAEQWVGYWEPQAKKKLRELIQ